MQYSNLECGIHFILPYAVEFQELLTLNNFLFIDSFYVMQNLL